MVNKYYYIQRRGVTLKSDRLVRYHRRWGLSIDHIVGRV